MATFNIYKISEENIQDLFKKFSKVGLKKQKNNNLGGYSMTFYISKNPDPSEVWWLDLCEDFLEDQGDYKNKSQFGALVAEKEDEYYVVSFGKTYFYLQQFCDPDFGLNFAERILDPESIKMKNSKFYKSIKSKTITSYISESIITFDSGESIGYLKGIPDDEEKYGSKVHCGTSAKFSLDITLIELPEVLDNIRKDLKKDPIFSIPRAQKITEEREIEELDKKLAEKIMEADISMDEFSVLGVNFIFQSDYRYKLYKVYQEVNESEAGDISIKDLQDFVSSNDMEIPRDFSKIKVKVFKDTGNQFTKSIKELLDYSDDERNCLVDGRWYKFNESYLDSLKSEVDKIDLEYGAEHDISSGVGEDEFIEMLENNDYLSTHTTVEQIGDRYSVEKMDLYKGETIYFVKVGQTGKMNYVVDQSMNTLRLLQHNDNEIEIDGQKKQVKNICLWIVLDKKKDLENISDTKSLIFLMKLVDWKKEVQNAGYKPIIKVNYRRN
ncbi:MAG: DUF6119 family protein [Candidatus Paceibacterota bacterium]